MYYMPTNIHIEQKPYIYIYMYFYHFNTVVASISYLCSLLFFLFVNLYRYVTRLPKGAMIQNGK